MDFSHKPWPSISDSAKDIILRCLDKDPARRITAEQALQHEWVRDDGVAADSALDTEVLVRMRAFAGMEKLKRLSLMVR